uniref:RNase H type-1 domain-containing protein n=1 Tax=Leptobrachium leishanense TaxID=445787 RepID=A0A8C5PLW0_9ANUR
AVSIMHCRGHQKGHDEIPKGNRRADQAAKVAARPLLTTDQAKVLLCKQEAQPPMPNYEFYLNWRKFEPKGEFIEIILHKWHNDYELLELNHDYIQWLFPTRSQGRNFYSTPLNPQETRLMINTSEVQQRIRRAYEMMLKFFGVKLMGEYGEDTEVTEVERAENFASRFENLTTNPHNNLRITRILLSLGELGAEEYQAPLVRFFLKEILIKNKLPRMKKSAMNFFIPAVRDSQERQDLLFFAWRYYFPILFHLGKPWRIGTIQSKTSGSCTPTGATENDGTTIGNRPISTSREAANRAIPNDSGSGEKSDEGNNTTLWTSSRNRVGQWPRIYTELFTATCPTIGYHLEVTYCLQAPKLGKSRENEPYSKDFDVQTVPRDVTRLVGCAADSPIAH